MTPEDLAARFARQALLPGLGEAQLEQLRGARVLVVGAGPVAGPALVALARAGVGTLYLEDGGDVIPGADPAWLFTSADAGRPRVLAAIDALRALAPDVVVRPAAIDLDADAALVCPGSEGVARRAAERARLAGIPHVVALAGGGPAEIVSVPYGAPCFACATRPSARTQPRGDEAAAAGLLAVLELELIVARVAQVPLAGRRLELAEGWPTAAPTARRPGCDCRNAY